MTPAFHFQILETFLKVFNKQSQVLCEIVEKRLETQEGIAEVDIYPLVSNCSLDIICGELFKLPFKLPVNIII